MQNVDEGPIKTNKTHDKTVLTHRGLEAMKPNAIAYRVPDLRCPGLAIRVAPSGLKTWDVAFRIRQSGKVRRLSLGPFPAMTLDGARERTSELTNAAKLGRDLLSEEKAAKAAADERLTVAELIELYLNRKVRGKLRTASEYEMRLKRALAPVVETCVDEVRRRDLRAILDKVVERGALREAEQQRQVMRVMFGWALSQDLIETDPTAGLASYGSSPRRERVLSDDEIQELWRWLEGGGLPQDCADAMKLQLAIGARIGEVSGLRVEEIDRTSWVWTLPSLRSKNGRQRITPLLGLAKEIVESRMDRNSDGCLFKGDLGGPLTSNSVASLLVKHRKKIPIAHFTSHDLRRTVATRLVDLGFEFDTVAAILGHEAGSREVRGLLRHYVRSDLIERKRQGLHEWNSKLLVLVRRYQ